MLVLRTLIGVSGSEQGRTGGALWATSRAVNGLMTSTRD